MKKDILVKSIVSILLTSAIVVWITYATLDSTAPNKDNPSTLMVAWWTNQKQLTSTLWNIVIEKIWEFYRIDNSHIELWKASWPVELKTYKNIYIWWAWIWDVTQFPANIQWIWWKSCWWDCSQWVIMAWNASSPDTPVIITNKASLNGYNSAYQAHLQVYWNIEAKWTVSSNWVQLSSDKRLKENIKPLTNSLENISKLKWYSYDFKSDKRKSMWVIAQEVEQVYPDLVNTWKDGMKSVNYDWLIPALIESVKELKKENEELRKIIEKK
jgi:hypothetical protein